MESAAFANGRGLGALPVRENGTRGMLQMAAGAPSLVGRLTVGAYDASNYGRCGPGVPKAVYPIDIMCDV